jgi:DHA2 family metal-tetracycline-proton antiporter-like MFS transporter
MKTGSLATQVAANIASNTADKLVRLVFFTLMLSAMNSTMFNVALPVLKSDFDLKPSEASWIVTSYTVIFALGTFTYGKFTDKYRIRTLTTFGIVLFAVGSLMGLFASQYWMVILARVIQAIGAAVIPTISLIIPIRFIPEEKRGRAIGVVSAGMALGTAIGPVISGLIASFLSWHYLFFLSFLVVLTLPFYRIFLKNEEVPAQTGRTDWLGGMLMAAAVALIMLSLTQSSISLLAIGLVTLAVFIVWVRKAEVPFVQLSLFKNHDFLLLLGVAFLATSVFFALPFMIPLMLAKFNHLSASEIGIVMFPGAAIAAFISKLGGKISDEKGNQYLAYIAFAFQFAAIALLSVTAGLSAFLIAAFLIFAYIGQMFLTTSLTNAVPHTLPGDQIGTGMGLFMLFNFISGSVSMALIGKALDFDNSALKLNPLLINENAAMYSNVLIVIALVIILYTGMYYFQNKSKNRNHQ